MEPHSLSRRHRRPRTDHPVSAVPKPDAGPPQPPVAHDVPPPFWTRTRTIIAVVLLLTAHLSLAVQSLVRENPTIDEVIHLPAGITYWQTGSFRMYPHNPPLVKLLAALPVVASGGFEIRYDSQPDWWSEPTNKAAFAHEFARANASQYFELFTRARLVMPLFSLLGGLVVFTWSRQLYGSGAGLLSLALWVFCPNILAHARLVTTDVGATSMGILATFVFWRYLKNPTWTRAGLAGLCLGLAELSKFSLILLYGIWPLLGFVHLLVHPASGTVARTAARLLAHAALIIAISVLVIDVGYAFEGVGVPLGRHEFVSATLTRPVPPGMWRPQGPDDLITAVYRNRVNRFRGGWLGSLPVPLPRHYLLGFDAQKFESEGVPRRFVDPRISNDDLVGYPVYLDGEVRGSGWWYYYLLTLVYKVPEGTWLLVLASLVVLAASPRSRAPWFDEVMVLTIPAVVLFAMSAFTNINLGLRYVLPIFPYLFVSAGKLVPWASQLTSARMRRAAYLFLGASIAATTAATLLVAPHYLAYFNWVSGGPRRGSEHLVDSNLDWGQDLVGLRRWLEKHASGEPVGLAYFGQINPEIFRLRDNEGFPWFLPPPLPGTMGSARSFPPRRYRGGLEGIRFQPGLYAVSATLLRGIDWRVYDSDRWAPYRAEQGAFEYFRELTPFANVGDSIFLYRVTPEQAAQLSRHWSPDRVKAGPG